MKHVLHLILAILLYLSAGSGATAQEEFSSSTDYINQIATSLEYDLKNKSEFIKLYDRRRPDYIRIRSQFRNELHKKQVLLYAQDYKNVFTLTSIYKDITTFPKEFRNRMVSTIQIDRVVATAKSDLERVNSLKENLNSIDVNGLDEKALQQRTQAIATCDSLITINTALINRAEYDSSKFDGLQSQIGELGREGETLKASIRKTITERGISFPYYLRNLDSFSPVITKSLESTLSRDGDSDARGKEFRFVIRSLIIGAVVCVLLSWLIFRVGLKDLLTRRGFYEKTPFYVLVSSLLFFSIVLASLNEFGQLDYYRKATALGPEFLLTIMIVILALSARLEQEKFWLGLLLYSPLIIICALLVTLRLVSAPDLIVQFTLPIISPLMAACSGILIYKLKGKLPRFDRSMAVISLIFLIISTILSWSGYAFVCFLLLLFWNILMCNILLLMAATAIMNHYELKREEQHKDSTPWFIPFCKRWLFPVAALFMLLFSFYWPMEVFDMGDVFVGSLWQKSSPTNGNSLANNVTMSNIIVILVMGITLNYLVYLAKNWLKDIYADKYETGAIPTLVTLGSLVAWSVFLIIALAIVGANFNGIFVVLGGMSLGLGFALKDTLENIISGISLMFGRLRQGDYVECDGVRGKVLTLGYRTTYMETLDGSIIAFQNTQLFNKNFRNLTQNHMYECAGIQVGIAYGADFDQVKEIIMDAIHNVDQLSKIRSPAVFLDGFGDSSITINVLVWVPVNAKGGVMSRVREEIYNALNQNGIEIPYPQQDVHIKEFPQAAAPAEKNDGNKASS